MSKGWGSGRGDGGGDTNMSFQYRYGDLSEMLSLKDRNLILLLVTKTRKKFRKKQ
jgi:hypothetical protein